MNLFSNNIIVRKMTLVVERKKVDVRPGPKSLECERIVQVQQKLYNQEVRASRCSPKVCAGLGKRKVHERYRKVVLRNVVALFGPDTSSLRRRIRKAARWEEHRAPDCAGAAGGGGGEEETIGEGWGQRGRGLRACVCVRVRAREGWALRWDVMWSLLQEKGKDRLNNFHLL